MEEDIYKTYKKNSEIPIQENPVQNPSYLDFNKKMNGGIYGWICPKCGRVYSPYIFSCPYCIEKPYQPTHNYKDK